jgi:hypothetical protein
MKLQLEAYNKKYTIETPNDDLDIFEYLDTFKGLLVSAGFQPDTIDRAIIELSDDLKDESHDYPHSIDFDL